FQLDGPHEQPGSILCARRGLGGAHALCNRKGPATGPLPRQRRSRPVPDQGRRAVRKQRRAAERRTYAVARPRAANRRAAACCGRTGARQPSRRHS
ncbi:MAG: hypothetical protein FJX72_17590, partial [Armatimonadetes bacterium]|nr:hypothetical protein [Armatimonadota bacterium]